MERLYIFAIGGTGARVIKALTMLMCVGEFTNFEIVPIFIDYDAANGNLIQTLDLLHKYKNINYKNDRNICDDGFFSSSLTSIHELSYDKNGNSSFLLESPLLPNMSAGDLLGYSKLTGDQHSRC